MLIFKRAEKPLPFGGLFSDGIADSELARIDRILDDEELLDILRRSYERVVGRSKRRGAPLIALNRLLRTIVLKHLKNWSFRDLSRELARNLDYRAFTQFFDETIRSFRTLSRNISWIDAQAVRELNERLVQVALEHDVIEGKSFRQDTTVTEANIHYPTDSTLLQDGCRVLLRTMRRAEDLLPSLGRARDRSRAIVHRVLEIHRSAKSRSPDAAEDRKRSYRSLMRISRSVTTHAERVAAKLADCRVTRRLGFFGQLAAEGLRDELETMAPRVDRVLRQTRARIMRGVTNHPGKLVSVFEPDAQPIRKGKLHKDTEFGRLVDLVEVENGFVSDYRVHPGNPADVTLLVPALWRHAKRFGRAPRRLAADRGFWSAANERAAREMGVKYVSLPARGRLGAARRLLQRSRWFRRLQRWRANGEGRISTLKNRYGMDRCMYKGKDAMERWVGWCVLANNLTVIARRSSQLGGTDGSADSEQEQGDREAA
jgi:IS5 family transposase